MVFMICRSKMYDKIVNKLIVDVKWNNKIIVILNEGK